MAGPSLTDVTRFIATADQPHLVSDFRFRGYGYCSAFSRDEEGFSVARLFVTCCRLPRGDAVSVVFG